jgi:hypothetical protein
MDHGRARVPFARRTAGPSKVEARHRFVVRPAKSRDQREASL